MENHTYFYLLRLLNHFKRSIKIKLRIAEEQTELFSEKRNLIEFNCIILGFSFLLLTKRRQYDTLTQI